MGRKRCKACGAKLGKKASNVVVPGCSHSFCSACMRERCVDSVNSIQPHSPFKGVHCLCGGEVALEAVEGLLGADEFSKYKNQWEKFRVLCASCSKAEFEGNTRAVPCGHTYCCECVRRMCRLALGDRALAPVRCCRKEIPIECVRESLSEEEFATYSKLLKDREVEWKRSDLLSDTEYAEAVRLVGAKHCPGCGIGVERDFGCIHMKCPVGHEFCFTCLRLWGSCNCPLLPDAEVRQILGED